MINYFELSLARVSEVYPARSEVVLRSAVSKLYHSAFHRLASAGGAMLSITYRHLQAHAAWTAAEATPAATLFLTALLLSDRWTHRG